jgi:succinoglycan biosynthesis protein ExoA
MNEIPPFVSIIMPVYNEGKYIRRSLEAVLRQNYPHERMEVLVVDGNSTDDTRARIQEIGRETPDVSICILDNPQRIVPSGLNVAISNANGDIIVRVDGHSRIAPDYVSRCVNHLLASNVAAVGGKIETIGETWLGRGIAIGMTSRFGVGAVSFRTSTARSECEPVDTIVFGAYWCRTLRDGGPFDEAMSRNEDDEYNFRLRKLGKLLQFCPDISSEYYCQCSLGGLWRQYYYYGLWKVRVMQKHPKQMSLRHFLPALLILYLVLNISLAFVDPRLIVLLIMAISIYMFALLFMTITLSFKLGFQYIVLLPFVFVVLHFAYGSGFLRGLIEFRRYWNFL